MPYRKEQFEMLTEEEKVFRRKGIIEDDGEADIVRVMRKKFSAKIFARPI